MASTSYEIVLSQLRTKLQRQQGAIEATKLHIEAIEKLRNAEAPKTK